MLTSLAIVVGGIVLAGAALKGLNWARRAKVVRAIPPDSIERAAYGLSLKVMTEGEHTFTSMNPGRANRTVGDLILTAHRFVVASSRGILVDAEAGRLASARCTGPGRLVIEGHVANTPDQRGRFRIELVVEEAEIWAAALAPFCAEDSEFAASFAGG